MRVVRTRIVAPALLLLAAALTTACGTTDQVAPAKYGDPAAIVSEVRVAPTEIRVDETMQIEVTVHNPTTLPIQVHFTSGCMVMFVVRDANGEPVTPQYVCTDNVPTLELAPGESLTNHFQWNGRVSGPFSPAVAPGEYQVYGGFDPGVQRNVSEPVAIKILAP